MKAFYIEKAHATMRYNDFPGRDQPIVFIHGLGCAGSFDYPQVAAQAELQKHRCIIVDLLGAGYSDKPPDFSYTVSAHAEYLADFVAALHLHDFVLFGHSLGGAIAIALAGKCQERVNRLLLSEANLDKSSEGSTSKCIADYEEDQFLKNGFETLIQDSRASGNQMWAASLSLWSREAAYRLSKSAAKGVEPSWRKQFYALDCPKTFLFGAKSLPDPDEQMLRQQGIGVDVVKNAGHSMAWENPSGLARAIAKGITT
ncbi:alpha/beta fold hydrolase [Sporolactobacillus terrae]|uniref:Alpha/beta hydrolase n=1 Tax=Sporolactobacillus terrae TaxID=269673 RepID=A0A410D5P6_9BACL|nr:alpha/beta hydrolase [Sporolactobacillus terrae]QAA21415.1 alpha/beta hydrolase [Sporolactobacillus terrae]QAA24387.1 alpha/beta hydrolase [Sporolactobacillus terrae]UAK16212.1 alpha/beta hydrolase [Sporolactobacillus terrae]BBN97676.1 alpha/beta hydrolase [Sporolactobacillus terrae]